MPVIHPPRTGIEEASIPTAALVSHWNVFHQSLEVNLARYDTVVCDLPGTRALPNGLVSPKHLLPLYSQITPIHKPYTEKKDIDVVSVGHLNHAAHSTRARYLQRLARLLDRYRIVIATERYGEDYARLLTKSRIIFNHSIRGEVNLRVLETMACGSLAVLEDSNEEVRVSFDVDREPALYNESNFEQRVT